jgi:hypothetical protein
VTKEKVVDEKVPLEVVPLEEQTSEVRNHFPYLIKDEDEDESLFLGTPIKYLPKFTKEEIEKILSSPFPQYAYLKELNLRYKFLIILLL